MCRSECVVAICSFLPAFLARGPTFQEDRLRIRTLAIFQLPGGHDSLAKRYGLASFHCAQCVFVVWGGGGLSLIPFPWGGYRMYWETRAGGVGWGMPFVGYVPDGKKVRMGSYSPRWEMSIGLQDGQRWLVSLATVALWLT